MHRNRTVMALAGFAMASLAAGHALARPDTRTMTCSQAQTMVQQFNSIVLTTGQNTYSRFVKGQGFCEPGQVTARATAPTMDTKKCAVGFRCQDRLTSR